MIWGYRYFWKHSYLTGKTRQTSSPTSSWRIIPVSGSVVSNRSGHRNANLEGGFRCHKPDSGTGGLLYSPWLWTTEPTPRKINSWNLKMMLWKMIFLLQGCILRFHVNLPGCKWDDPSSKVGDVTFSGRSKNVDTTKFYKILEVDKCQSSVFLFLFRRNFGRMEDRNETNMWYI